MVGAVDTVAAAVAVVAEAEDDKEVAEATGVGEDEDEDAEEVVALAGAGVAADGLNTGTRPNTAAVPVDDMKDRSSTKHTFQQQDSFSH